MHVLTEPFAFVKENSVRPNVVLDTNTSMLWVLYGW